MIRPITKDVLFLGHKADIAKGTDLTIANDLMDTLKANSEHCVGMAANMIGVCKRIIAISTGLFYMTMFNPEITKKSVPYEAEEGCLSLVGTRKTIRYEKIEVKYQDGNFNWHTQEFRGFPAQIIQHEIDHCDGVVI